MYFYALVVHLLCAVTFIGVVFFEVFILEGIRGHIGEKTMLDVEEGLVRRARRIMPFVVALLFISGGYLGTTQFMAMGLDFSNSIIVLLSIKIVLAVSVLIHFINAMLTALNGCMTSERLKWTHLSVFVHMVLIVILAKAMFYFSW